MQRVEETQEPEANNKLLTIGGRGWTSPLCTQQCPRPQDSEKAPGTTLQFASHSGLVLIREVGRHADTRSRCSRAARARATASTLPLRLAPSKSMTPAQASRQATFASFVGLFVFVTSAAFRLTPL